MAETTDGKLINRQDVIGVIIVVIALAFLIIVACFTFRTFSPQKSYFPESISVNVVDAGERNKELSIEGKYYLKEQLHTALMEVSGKAESAYNEKFATLLTVLTIFGVAWPLILSVLQNINFRHETNVITKEFQMRSKQMSEEFQQQKEQMSKEFRQQTEQMSKDFQQQTEQMSKVFQQQHKKINNLSRRCYHYFAYFFLVDVDASGIKHGQKRYTTTGERDACSSEDPNKVTSALKKLFYTLDCLRYAERETSSDANSETILFFIKRTSNSVYNLVWNYNNIIYEKVQSDFDKYISIIEKLNLQHAYVKESLDNLEKAKEQLELDHREQSNS